MAGSVILRYMTVNEAGRRRRAARLGVTPDVKELEPCGQGDSPT
jgi:hypothetical protein